MVGSGKGPWHLISGKISTVRISWTLMVHDCCLVENLAHGSILIFDASREACFCGEYFSPRYSLRTDGPGRGRWQRDLR